MRYEADGKGLFAQVIDGAALELLVEPPPLAAAATQDADISLDCQKKSVYRTKREVQQSLYTRSKT